MYAINETFFGGTIVTGLTAGVGFEPSSKWRCQPQHPSFLSMEFLVEFVD